MKFTPYESPLYHYCKLETAIELILPHRQLLLSPYEKTNDPRENHTFSFAGRWEAGTKVGNRKQLNEEISKKLRADCKLICFSQNYKQYFGFESSRMWAYYGGEHKGLCLQLDRQAFLEENKNIVESRLLRKIRYFKLNLKKATDNKQINFSILESMGESQYLEHFRRKYLDYLYFTKNYEWESEREVRLLHFSKRKENEYCSIDKSLTAIHLGVAFSDVYLPALKHLCPNVEIRRTRYQDIRIVSSPIYEKY